MMQPQADAVQLRNGTLALRCHDAISHIMQTCGPAMQPRAAALVMDLRWCSAETRSYNAAFKAALRRNNAVPHSHDAPQRWYNAVARCHNESRTTTLQPRASFMHLLVGTMQLRAAIMWPSLAKNVDRPLL